MELEARIADKRWVDAARIYDSLWALLYENEDLLRGVSSAGEHQNQAGARSQLRQLLRAAPGAFVHEYNQQFGAEAAQQLNAAFSAGHRKRVRQLIARYEPCEVSHHALVRLIEAAQIHGSVLDVGLLLDQLARTTGQLSDSLELSRAVAWHQAGLSSIAREILQDLSKSMGADAAVSFAGRTVALPEAGVDPKEWLNRLAPVLMADRTLVVDHAELASNGDVLPDALESDWTQTLIQSPSEIRLAEWLERLEEMFRFQRSPAILPPLPVLLVGDRIICQGIGSVLAFDRHTGRLVWETSRFNHQLKAALLEAARDGGRGFSSTDLGSILFDGLRNHTRGEIVSDGRVVYCVEETTQAVNTTSSAATQATPFNILRAYDAANGRLLAEAGGAADSSTAAPSHLTSLYFLGAPLIIDDRLLILSEDDQGIQLLDLRLSDNFGSGDTKFRVADRQLLSLPRWGLSLHPLRRYSGLRPVFASGLIICHGGDERVYGVSPSDLSIQWVYRYRTNVNLAAIGNVEQPVIRNTFDLVESAQLDHQLRPASSNIRPAGRYVLLMPRDSDHFICLDSTTGAEVWSQPRGDIVYFAGVDERLTVVAAADRIRAVETATGRLIWERDLTEERLSGQPAWTQEHVYLPTSLGRILTLSRQTGRLLLHQKPATERLGHLVVCNRQVFSNSDQSLRSWIPGGSASTDALAGVRSQLMQEKTEEAIDRLEAIMQSGDEDVHVARNLLAEQLLESLRVDFDHHRHRIPQLQRLLNDTSLRSDQVATVLHHSLGMSLLDVEPMRLHWRNLQRPTRYRDQLHALMLKGVLSGTDLSAEELKTSVAGFVTLALTDFQRQQQTGRIRRRVSVQTVAVIERALQRLDRASRRSVLANLEPVLADLLDKNRAPQDLVRSVEFCRMAGMSTAVPHAALEQLSTVHPSLLAAVLADPDDGMVRSVSDEALNQAFLFHPSGTVPAGTRSLSTTPQGRGNDVVGRLADLQAADFQSSVPSVAQVAVSSDRSAAVLPNSLRGSAATIVPLHGTPGMFRGWQFIRRHQVNGISAVDPFGRICWHFSPTPQHVRRSNLFRRQQEDYAVACGRLLCLVENGRLYAVDGALIENGAPRILWSVDLNQILPQQTSVQRRARAFERTDMYDRRPDGLVLPGPLTESGLALLRGNRLVVLSPWTGAVHWSESPVAEDTRLVAAGDRLCLISESAGSMQVRNMCDGTTLKTGTLPDWWAGGNLLYDTSVRHVDLEEGIELPWRVCVEGTHCLMFYAAPSQCWLRSWDLAQIQQDGPTKVWEQKLPENSVFSNIADGLVAVLSDDEKLQLFRISDGQSVAEQQISVDTSCERLYLRRSHDQWIVLTWCPNPLELPEPVIGTVPVNGPVVAINRITKEVSWTTRANNEVIRLRNPEQSVFPSSAPLLVLLRLHVSPLQQGVPRSIRYSARILGAQTGDTLYESDDVGRTLNYHTLKFDPENRYVVGFERRNVTIDFTEDVLDDE